MQKLTLVMLACLMLTLSLPLQAQDQQAYSPDQQYQDQELQQTRYNQAQEKKIADKLKDGELCANDNELLNQALNECTQNISGSKPQFWQKPGFVIGGMVVTVSLTTVLICLTHALGACQ